MNNFWRDAFSLITVFVLVLLNGIFVAAEFALVSVRRTRIDQLANEGSRAAKRVQHALSHLETYIAGTQLGVTMAALGLGSLGEPVISQILEPLFALWLPESKAIFTAHAVALTLAFALVTAVDITIGELIPKSIAFQRADRAAMLLTPFLEIFLKIFRPFILGLNAISNLFLRLLGLQPVGEYAAVHTPEEIELLIHSTTEAGLLAGDQERMVTGVFDFGDTVARKLMTPRLDITAVEADIETQPLIGIITESGHSRLPVYDDNLDNIIGVLNVKDVLQPLLTDPDAVRVRALMRPPYFVPENKRADFLLAELRRSKVHMAIVRDEYGTVVGVITIEDLLEEIVGDIQDEYDVEEPPIQVIDATTTLIDGKTPLGDVNERMDLDLPEEEGIDTLGGFVFGLLGHQAAQGERVRWHNVEFVVDATDGRRITKVRCIHRPMTVEPDLDQPPPETEPETRNGQPDAADTAIISPSGDEMH